MEFVFGVWLQKGTKKAMQGKDQMNSVTAVGIWLGHLINNPSVFQNQSCCLYQQGSARSCLSFFVPLPSQAATDTLDSNVGTCPSTFETRRDGVFSEKVLCRSWLLSSHLLYVLSIDSQSPWVRRYTNSSWKAERFGEPPIIHRQRTRISRVSLFSGGLDSPQKRRDRKTLKNFVA